MTQKQKQPACVCVSVMCSVSSSNSRLQKTELYFIKNNFVVSFSENCPGACGDTKLDFLSVGSWQGKTFASEHNG